MVSLVTFSSLFVLLLSGVEAQVNNAASEFFLAYSKNHRFGYYDTLSLVISTPESQPVSYEVSSPYGYYASGTVYPSSSVYLYPYWSMTVDSDTDRNKGILVRATDSTKTLVVSGMNYETYTVDAFLALPTGPVREEYTYISNSMLWTNRSGDTFPSLILIVGTQDNTVLTITPTEYVIIPYDLRDPINPQYFVHPGQSYNVTLNRLQTYQIESNLDLTGSRIASNKPLSVFAGHECTDVPGGVTACDHLFEQVPPTSTWGRFFFLVPSDSAYRTSPEWYRIVASRQSTTVSITCYSFEDSLHAFSYHAYIGPVGGFEQFQMERDNYCYVSADKPVLVMQYAYGGSVNNGHGDPFMMMILPNEQYVTNTTIQFYAYSSFISDITIVVLQQQTPSNNILLDSVPLVSEWTPLYCAEGELCGYTLRMQINNGFHSIRHISNLVPVAVYVYGFEWYQGYGYPAAMALKNLEVLECSDGAVRLVDGETDTEGRVEVCQGGVWGTICNDHWTHKDTDVVCGELGLLSSGITDRFYGEGEGPILLDNVECLGVESTVLECLYDTHTADCSHSQDAGAVCLPYPEPVVELQQVPPNSTQYYSGYDFTLSCLVSVSAEVVDRVLVTTTWSKDDREYSNNWDSRISVSPVSLTSDGVYATSLKFSPLDSRDTGTYQCMAVLTSYTGISLANATVTTSLTVEDLPQQFVQLQLYGVENCYQWMQSGSSGGVDQSVAAAVSTGVESLCDCGFSANNLNQIILQCFPDNPAKMNLLLLLQATLSRDTSEIVGYLNTWIAGDPRIVLGDQRNTTVRVNSECDVTVIQGSECTPTTQSPPTSPSLSYPSPTPSNEPGVSTAAQSSDGRDLTAVGGTLIVIAVVTIAVSVVVVIAVLVKYRVCNINSYSLRNRLHRIRDIRIFYRKAKVPEQFEGDKRELTKDDGCEEPTVVVDPALINQDTTSDGN